MSSIPMPMLPDEDLAHDAAVQRELDATRELRLVHVIGPLGEPKCQECGSEEVEKRGSMDWGPFYWECHRGHQWGHA